MSNALDDFVVIAKTFRRSAREVKKVLKTDRQACAAHRAAVVQVLAQLTRDIREMEQAFNVEKARREAGL